MVEDPKYGIIRDEMTRLDHSDERKGKCHSLVIVAQDSEETSDF